MYDISLSEDERQLLIALLNANDQNDEENDLDREPEYEGLMAKLGADARARG